MSQKPPEGPSMVDPFGFWKATRDANLDAWSKLMIDLVNSDAYAQATVGAFSEALSASQPFRQALDKMIASTQATLNLPSRAEVSSLAERLVNVELRLDDLDAKLGAVQKAVQEVVRQATAQTAQHLQRIEAQLAALDATLQAARGSAAPRSGPGQEEAT